MLSFPRVLLFSLFISFSTENTPPPFDCGNIPNNTNPNKILEFCLESNDVVKTSNGIFLDFSDSAEKDPLEPLCASVIEKFAINIRIEKSQNAKKLVFCDKLFQEGSPIALHLVETEVEDVKIDMTKASFSQLKVRGNMFLPTDFLQGLERVKLPDWDLQKPRECVLKGVSDLITCEYVYGDVILTDFVVKPEYRLKGFSGCIKIVNEYLTADFFKHLEYQTDSSGNKINPENGKDCADKTRNDIIGSCVSRRDITERLVKLMHQGQSSLGAQGAPGAHGEQDEGTLRYMPDFCARTCVPEEIQIYKQHDCLNVTGNIVIEDRYSPEFEKLYKPIQFVHGTIKINQTIPTRIEDQMSGTPLKFFVGLRKIKTDGDYHTPLLVINNRYASSLELPNLTEIESGHAGYTDKIVFSNNYFGVRYGRKWIASKTGDKYSQTDEDDLRLQLVLIDEGSQLREFSGTSNQNVVSFFFVLVIIRYFLRFH